MKIPIGCVHHFTFTSWLTQRTFEITHCNSHDVQMEAFRLFDTLNALDWANYDPDNPISPNDSQWKRNVQKTLNREIRLLIKLYEERHLSKE